MTLMASPDSGNLMLGRGAVYFDRFIKGTTTRQGEAHMGNVTALGVTTTDDIKDKFSSMVQNSPLYGSVPVHRTVEIKLVGDEYDIKNIALALLGEQGKLAQAGATVTGEALTASSLQGRYFPTVFRKISAVTVKEGATYIGATDCVLNTDYTIDADTGRIYVVPGGGIVDASLLWVDYTYATISLDKIAGGSQGKVEGYLRFVGDPAAGPAVELEAWHSQVKSDGEVGFIQDDYGNYTLTMRVLDDSANHPSDPLYRLIYK